MAHSYLSTACFHGQHGTTCRSTCKFCDAPCTCSCHVNPFSGDRAALPEPWVDQARDIAVQLLDAVYPADVPDELAQRIADDPDLFWLRGEEAPNGCGL
jgi:hypothetical protein